MNPASLVGRVVSGSPAHRPPADGAGGHCARGSKLPPRPAKTPSPEAGLRPLGPVAPWKGCSPSPCFAYSHGALWLVHRPFETAAGLHPPGGVALCKGLQHSATLWSPLCCNSSSVSGLLRVTIQASGQSCCRHMIVQAPWPHLLCSLSHPAGPMLCRWARSHGTWRRRCPHFRRTPTPSCLPCLAPSASTQSSWHRVSLMLHSNLAMPGSQLFHSVPPWYQMSLLHHALTSAMTSSQCIYCCWSFRRHACGNRPAVLQHSRGVHLVPDSGHAHQ